MIPAMSTTVFLRLKDGRRIQFARAHDTASAQKVRTGVEGWIADGMTLSLANSRGEIEDVAAKSIVAIELMED